MIEIIQKKHKGFVLKYKWVTLDGEEVIKLRCPLCEIWGQLDDDQYNGRVSIQCSTEGCSFHETVDLAN